MAINVWVTRDEQFQGPLSRALARFGLNPIVEPVITRTPTTDTAQTLASLAPDDWLIFTSAFAVDCLPDAAPRRVHLAAVGPMTAQAARNAGFKPDIVTPRRNRDDLLRRLRPLAKNCVVCYPRSNRARPIDPWPGVEIRCPVVYTITPRPFDRRVLDRIDIVAVTSPSAVQAIGPIDRPFASIGSTTSNALRRIGITPAVQPDEPSFDDLARAIAEHTGNLTDPNRHPSP